MDYNCCSASFLDLPTSSILLLFSKFYSFVVVVTIVVVTIGVHAISTIFPSKSLPPPSLEDEQLVIVYSLFILPFKKLNVLKTFFMMNSVVVGVSISCFLVFALFS